MLRGGTGSNEVDGEARGSDKFKGAHSDQVALNFQPRKSLNLN